MLVTSIHTTVFASEPVLEDGEYVVYQDFSQADGTDAASRKVDYDEAVKDVNFTNIEHDNGKKIDVDTLAVNDVVDENARFEVIVELKSEPIGTDIQKLSAYHKPEFQESSSRTASKLEEAQARQAEALKVKEVQLRAETIISEQEAVINDIVSMDADAEIICNYTTIINGFAANLSYKDMLALRENPLVKDVYISNTYEAPVTPDDLSATKMVSANYAWTSGYQGEGKLIAIVDTGIKYDHELLNNLDAPGRIMKNDFIARVEEVKNTVGLTARVDSKLQYYFNDKVIFGYDYRDKDRDPMDDLVGHGTHVAGITAANATDEGVVIGMAPKAQLMAMKVFSSADGSSSDAAILAGVEDAFKLGADSINLSLGTPCGFDSYPGNYGMFNLENAFNTCDLGGTYVASSAGNSSWVGQNSLLHRTGSIAGYYPYAEFPDYGTVGAPGTFASANTVASAENANLTLRYFVYNGQNIRFTDTGTKHPASEVFHGKTMQYVNIPGFGAISDYAGLDVNGKIVLVSRGGDSTISAFATKVNNARSRGAAGVIIRNNVEGIIMVGTDANTAIPVIAIEKANGEILAAAGGGSVTFDKGNVILAESGAEGISTFSSRGVTPSLQLKPDLTGVGGMIYSTVITPEKYNYKSGTSMATPQVAGAAVLVREYVEKKFPNMPRKQQEQLIENLLMSSARPIKDEKGIYYSAQAQGAGLIDMYGALETAAVMYAKDNRTKIELGDHVDSKTVKFDVYIENIGITTKKFELSGTLLADNTLTLVNTDDSSDTLHLNTTLEQIISENVVFTSNNAIISGKTLTLTPLAKAKITVTFTVTDAMRENLSYKFKNGYFVNGFVFAKPVGELYELSIPFLGFVGDWSATPIFDKSTMYDEIESLESYPFYAVDRMVCESQILGYNPYNATIYSKDLIAISPNGNNEYDIAAPMLAMMRSTTNAYAEVYDSEGQKVKHIDGSQYDNMRPKTFTNPAGQLVGYTFGSVAWDGTDDSGAVLPDGQYNYVLTCIDIYGNPQSWECPVAIDNTYPTYNYEIYQEGSEWFIRVDAHDNHKLRTIWVTANAVGGDGVQSPNVTDYSFTFNITRAVEEFGIENIKKNVTVGLADYAENRVSEFLEKPDNSGLTPAIGISSVTTYLTEGVPFEANVNIVTGTNIEDKTMYATLMSFVNGKIVPVPGVIEVPIKFGANRIYIPEVPATPQHVVFWDLRIEGQTTYRRTTISTKPWTLDLWEKAEAFAEDEGYVSFKVPTDLSPAIDERPVFSYLGEDYPSLASPHGFTYIEQPYIPGETLRIHKLKYFQDFFLYTFEMTFVLQEIPSLNY